ncbi:MAG TPA: two-component system response regulator [Verrucomicrobiales bacterium]|nr:two-component system response regulator [Verrucomicrobiales bacterium]
MNESNEVQVLLVEDNPRDAELTLRTLRRHHLANHVVHVKDGEEALEWLFGTGRHAGRETAARPRVVLLDLKLPKVSGLEVLRAIRADERTRHLPVVVLTSSREQKDVVEGYALGLNSYVVKPVEFEDFSRALVELGHFWVLVNQPSANGQR